MAEEGKLLEIYDPEHSSWCPVTCIELVMVIINPIKRISSILLNEFIISQMNQLIPNFSAVKGYKKTREVATSESQARDIILKKATNPNVSAVIIPFLTIQLPPLPGGDIPTLDFTAAILTTIPEGKGPAILNVEGGGEAGIRAIRDLVRVQSSRCFIATAVCGPYSWEVKVLRNFRDQTLMTTLIGRFFIYFYYRLSPPLARLIEKSGFMRRLIRICVICPVAKFIRGKFCK